MFDAVSTQFNDVSSGALGFVSQFSAVTIAAGAGVLVLTLFGLKYGKDRLTALLLSIYVALVVYLHFPYVEIVPLIGNSPTYTHVAIFLVLALIAYIIVGRVVVSSYRYGGRDSLPATLILAVATVALLLALSFHIIPIAAQYEVGESLRLLFASPQWLFWWLAAPLAALLMLSR